MKHLKKIRERALWHGAFLLILAALFAPRFARGDDLQNLGRDFWAWRARTQPVSGDDITRMDRPAGWAPDWSRRSIEERRKSLAEFVARWKGIDSSGMPVVWQVDYRLLGSALARVRWELEVLRSWDRNPRFYVDQTLGTYFESLLAPPPFSRARGEQIARLLESIPSTIDAARVNLTAPIGPFARLAAEELKGVGPRLTESVAALKPLLPAEIARRLEVAAPRAITALESWAKWLDAGSPLMPSNAAVGRDRYDFFLAEVALLPFTTDDLLAAGRQEWARAVALETMETNRNRALPPLLLFSDEASQIAREEKDEASARRFLEEKGLLTVPADVRHYRNRPLPAYVAPLAFLGVADDLTSASRLGEDSVSYIRPPSPSLPYFALSTARDPRPILVHEGIPGHYLQLVLSWKHEDPIRRHYYDSAANEGIGFYAEEMMLQAGYFDDSPRTREIVANFQRLRALRVEADVKLASGQFTIEQAAEYLEKRVPMDRETALQEAAFFASDPGQAISYLIGKLQIVKLLADARQQQGNKFDLRAFHDFLWKNGNVPLSLLRWELLGDKEEIGRVDAARRRLKY
jgi:hypothetical protein